MGELIDRVNIEEIKDYIVDTYEPRYALIHGSAARGDPDYNDIDVVIIRDDGPGRSFVSDSLGDDRLDIHLQNVRIFKSYVNNYHWYKDDMAAIVGKFTNGITIVHDTEIEAVRQAITSPSPEIRFTMGTYHLGELISARSQKNDRDWNDLTVNVPWSVVSVLSAYWDKYPEDVDGIKYAKSAVEEGADLLTPILDAESFSSSVVSRLLSLTAGQFGEWLQDQISEDEVQLFFRAQKIAAIEIAKESTLVSPDEFTIKYVDR